MNNTVYIYGLWDPRNYQLRYIGKSNNPEQRLKAHIGESKRDKKWNTRKENWIRQLLSEDLEPSIEILEECTEDNWQEAEKAWIAECKEKGLDLCNITKGGEGINIGPFTEEHKRNISKAKKGFIPSIETRKLWSQQRKGKNNPNYGGNKGKKNPMYGKKHTEKSKQKMSENSKAEKNGWYGVTGEKNPRWKTTRSNKEKRQISLGLYLYNANKRGDLEKVKQLQEEHYELLGFYHEKYIN